MIIEEKGFKTIETAAHALADNLALAMREAITIRGQALLAVSGGRTPIPVFKRLNQLDVDWNKVTITLTDERWVPVDDPDSNEGLVRLHLLHGPVLAANFIPLYGGEESPEIGQRACETRLRAMTLPFDAVYLGMGSDGHFASLFPGDPAVDVHNSLSVAVPAKKSRQPRMSLTVSAILNTKMVFLLFSGADKHTKYAEAKNKGSCKDIPLRLIMFQEKTPVKVLYAP